MEIKIEGDPIPASRPRFSGRRAYRPKRDVEYREVVQRAAIAAMDGAPPLTGAVAATVRLFRRFKPTARNFGDVDNHAKAILDALNGICYKDDSQVTSCTVTKSKDAACPRTEIELVAVSVDRKE